MPYKDRPDPSLGVSPSPLTIEPLGTEEELTPGPNDWNPFEDDYTPEEVDDEQLEQEFARRGFPTELDRPDSSDEVTDLPFWDSEPPQLDDGQMDLFGPAPTLPEEIRFKGPDF